MTSKPSLIVTGGSGLLGLNWGLRMRDFYDVTLLLHNKIINPEGVKVAKISLGSKKDFQRAINASGADMVIHTAGLTNIELCEKDPDLAREVNAQYSANVSWCCREVGIPMVHVSTDNLFDGEDSMVTEEHSINPVNFYGKSKAEAEQRVLDMHQDVMVVRTNFYGWGPTYRPSFSDSIITRLREQTRLSLFTDVYYTPIYIPLLVDAVHVIMERGGRGVFHVVGDEKLSKLEFGLKIAGTFGLNPDCIQSGRLSEMKNLVRRPFDMSLSNAKARAFLGHGLSGMGNQLSDLKKDEESAVVGEIRQLD
jgi:dTDP-4-dehydrorhamnose reductase